MRAAPAFFRDMCDDARFKDGTLAMLFAVLALAVFGAAPAFAQAPVEQPIDESVEQAEGCSEEEGDDGEAEPCDDEDYVETSDGEAAPAAPRTRTSRPHDSTVPKVRRVRASRSGGGWKLSFRLSEAADVTLVFERCTIYKPHRCIHYSRTHTRLEQRGRRGRNSALVGAGSLKPGRYRVEVHAVDGGHHHSNVGRAVFFVG